VTNGKSGTAVENNQLIGTDASIAMPPQLVVTSAASNVVIGRNREPLRLFKMYNAGNGMAHAKPAATVNVSDFISTADRPWPIPIVSP
jgi:hypothetical protein